MAVMEKRVTSWAIDPDALASAGGPTFPFTAAVALKIGDAVHISAANTVTKTAVAADGVKFIGIVVGGGGSFGGGYGIFESASTGLALVAAGKVAEVQVHGIAWVVAGAAIVVGAEVGLDTTTAGRVLTNVTAGQKIGIALTAATNPGDKIKILLYRR
jgi:hypothetical protein